MVEASELWESYWTSGSSEDLFALVEFYQPFLKDVAASVAFNLPNHVDFDDLVSEGQFGLISAIKRYEDQGYKFETYASFRIRGQIIDKLRVADWAPRSLRTALKEIEEAELSLLRDWQRFPLDEEVAEILDIDLEKLSELRGRGARAMIGHLDEVTSVDGESVRVSDLIPDSNSYLDIDNLEPVKVRLVDALSELTDFQSALLSLCYVHQIPLKEIGKLLGVTESRICQLQVSVLSDLRTRCLA